MFFMQRKRAIIIFGVILLLCIGLFLWWLLTHGKESTDDAQVEGHIVPISPRVAGYVSDIYVDDNQQVDKGHLLVLLDQKQFIENVRKAQANLAAAKAQAAASGEQVSVIAKTAPSTQEQAQAAVDSARANVTSAQSRVNEAKASRQTALSQIRASQDAVAAAQSEIEASDAKIAAAKAAVEAAQAEVISADAQAKKTASDLKRYRHLHAGGAASEQQLESIETANTSAQAALNSARQQANSAQASLNQAKAGRAGAVAALKRANAQLAAAQSSANQAGSAVETAQSAVNQQKALLQQSQKALFGTQTVPQQVSISQAQKQAARAAVKQAIAQLQNAQLDLTHTRIAAPVEGMVSQKSVQLGQYVQPGQMLMAVVPLKKVWIVANFKETQTGQMKRGQRAVFTVDAYPGRKFRGVVDSIGAATIAKSSLLPSENASGNFVKVVQRIPVKIVLDQPLPRGVVLRPGQNVIATVYL